MNKVMQSISKARQLEGMLRSIFLNLKSDIAAENDHVRFLEKKSETLARMNQCMRVKILLKHQNRDDSRYRRENSKPRSRINPMSYNDESLAMVKLNDDHKNTKIPHLGKLEKLRSKPKPNHQRQPHHSNYDREYPKNQMKNISLLSFAKLGKCNDSIRAYTDRSSRGIIENKPVSSSLVLYGPPAKKTLQINKTFSNQIQTLSPKSMEEPETTSFDLYKKNLLKKLLLKFRSNTRQSESRSQLSTPSHQIDDGKSSAVNTRQLSARNSIVRQKHHHLNSSLRISSGEQPQVSPIKNLSIIREITTAHKSPDTLKLDDELAAWMSPENKTRFFNDKSLTSLLN